MKKLISALALAALAAASVGCSKTETTATDYCNPQKMADTYLKVISADGSIMQATAEGLQYGQTEACGEKTGQLMVANAAKYQVVLDAFVKHNACMEDAFQCN